VKSLSLALFLSLALLGTANARLGETKEQAVERYGKPVQELEAEGRFESFICSKDGYLFLLKFLDGKVAYLVVTCAGNEGLKEEEVEIFLKKNASGSGFVEVKVAGLGGKKYFESDSGRLALWEKFRNQLTLATKAGYDYSGELNKQNLEDKTGGF